MPRVIKPVAGCPGFFVGNDGSVWTKWRKCFGSKRKYFLVNEMELLEPAATDGYPMVPLRPRGSVHVHRLVLEAFIGPCPEGTECLHRDGNKQNNNLTNLRWGTRLENVQDSIRHGTFYNASKAGADATRGVPRTEEAKTKISVALTGRVRSEEHCASLSRNHWSKGPNAKEAAAKLSASHTGLPGRKGETCNFAKLTDDSVRQILRLYRNGMPQNEIAVIFGVNKTTVWNIVHRKTWTHVTEIQELDMFEE